MDETRRQNERLYHYLETNKAPKHPGVVDEGDDDTVSPGCLIWPRVECCNSSRSFYCPECCTVLIPVEYWPSSIQDGSLTLPFTFDIILDVKERRTSSTGIQMMGICNMMKVSSTTLLSNQQQRLLDQTQPEQPMDENFDKDLYAIPDSLWWKNANLYDLNRVELPQYINNNDICIQFDKLHTNNNDNGSSAMASSSSDGTYILFPQKGKSVPISSVAHKLKRLVVLDIKWSKLSLITTNNPNLSRLPMVHLDSPPKESHFWRWHNAGDGMLSTAEAIYYAALEVSAASVSSRQMGWTDDMRDRMIDVLWLFALQRSIIGHRNSEAGIPVAYSKEGKARQVAARRRKDQKDQSAQQKRSQKPSFYENKSSILNGEMVG
jgi:hypothetical protein